MKKLLITGAVVGIIVYGFIFDSKIDNIKTDLTDVKIQAVSNKAMPTNKHQEKLRVEQLEKMGVVNHTSVAMLSSNTPTAKEQKRIKVNQKFEEKIIKSGGNPDLMIRTRGKNELAL